MSGGVSSRVFLYLDLPRNTRTRPYFPGLSRRDLDIYSSTSFIASKYMIDIEENYVMDNRQAGQYLSACVRN